jgi:hypothetical protein
MANGRETDTDMDMETLIHVRKALQLLDRSLTLGIAAREHLSWACEETEKGQQEGGVE